MAGLSRGSCAIPPQAVRSVRAVGAAESFFQERREVGVAGEGCHTPDKPVTPESQRTSNLRTSGEAWMGQYLSGERRYTVTVSVVLRAHLGPRWIPAWVDP